jgi:hypothetical protein
MRPGSFAISVLSLGIALAAVIWWGRSDVIVSEIPVAPTPAVELSDLPKPAEEGPYPRAIVDNNKHNFGVMQHGEKGEHDYAFTNEGEAPLRIAVGSSTCQCTVGELEGIKTIQPGESTKVKLSWTIKNPSHHFEHSAEIHTNDPKDPQITLTISGIVGSDFVRVPEGDWSLGSFRRDSEASFVGTVLSETQEFKVLKAECSSDLFKVEYWKVDDDQMEDVMSKRQVQAPPPQDVRKSEKSPPMPHPTKPKAAWYVKVTTVGEVPVGSMRATVTLHTDLKEMLVNTFDLTAKKEGPLKIIPIPRKGLRYFSERLLLDVGEFDAKDGIELKLMMLVSEELKEKLQITSVSDPKWIEVDVKEALVKKGSSRYELTIRIPPNSPALVRTTNNPAMIVLTTNCPDAREIPIRVAYVSQ